MDLKPGDVVTIEDWPATARLVFGTKVAPLVTGKVISVDEAKGLVHFWADRHGTSWSKQRTLPLANVRERPTSGASRRATQEHEAAERVAGRSA